MSEEISIEDLCKAKIAQDFELFMKRKMNIGRKIKMNIPTDQMSAIEEILEKRQMPENVVLEGMYKEHAEALRQEVHDGNFSAMKKCNYCKRFYQDYENKNGILPCPKMQAYQKMIDPDREKLTEKEYREIYNGQLSCKNLYLPTHEQEKINEELAEIEREQLEAINEWEAIALLGLNNL